MPTCDFFSSTSHYQSDIQSFGKVPKASQNFSDAVEFILFICQDGGNLGHWDLL